MSWIAEISICYESAPSQERSGSYPIVARNYLWSIKSASQSAAGHKQSKSIRLWKNLEVGVGFKGASLEVKNLFQAKLSTLKSTLSSETLASPITERKLLEDLRSPLFRLAYSSCLLGGAGSFLRKWKAIVPSTTCPACVPGSYS